MTALYMYCTSVIKHFGLNNAVKLAHIPFSLRIKGKRALHEIYCLHFLQEIILKLRQSVREHGDNNWNRHASCAFLEISNNGWKIKFSHTGVGGIFICFFSFLKNNDTYMVSTAIFHVKSKFLDNTHISNSTNLLQTPESITAWIFSFGPSER